MTEIEGKKRNSRQKQSDRGHFGPSSELPESGLAVADIVHRPVDEMKSGRSDKGI